MLLVINYSLFKVVQSKVVIVCYFGDGCMW